MILITGVSGYIGSSLAKYLLNQGEDVIGIDAIRNRETELLIGKGLIFYQIDLSTSSVVNFLEFEITVIYHLAAIKRHSRVSTLEEFVSNNVTSTVKLIELAKLTSATLVFASTLYVYGNLKTKSDESSTLNPESYYGASKAACEQFILAAIEKEDIKGILARLYFVVGDISNSLNYQNVIHTFVDKGKRKLPLQVRGTGNAILNYVWINDVIDTLVRLAMRSKSETVNVANDEAVSVLEIAKYISNIYKVPIQFTSPDWTEGTIRHGSNETLKQLIGKNDFMPPLKIMNTIVNSYEQRFTNSYEN
jgi:nucleoside-diphosphate-sugar epimerase